MRVGQKHESRAGHAKKSAKQREPEAAASSELNRGSPEAPDSIAGVSLVAPDDFEPPSARASVANHRGARRFGLPAAALLCAVMLVPFQPQVRGKMASAWSDLRAHVGRAAHAARMSAPQPAPNHLAPEAAPPSKEREKARPRHRPGRSPIAQGVFHLPEELRVAEDGTVDLVIHFHGNTEMVLESMDHAALGAAVAVVNLGVGSGPYEDRFDNPENYLRLLDSAGSALERRGVENAKIGRVALCAWSAGYGAVLRILKNEALARQIDSVLLLDGMHVGSLPDGHTNWISIRPFEAFAERAARGETLFVVTHSNIEPVGYLGVKETSDRLLENLGIVRAPKQGTDPLLGFSSFVGVLPKAEMVALEQSTQAEKNGLVVKGYRGNQPNVHIAHLMQMAQTALPELRRRWVR